MSPKNVELHRAAIVERALEIADADGIQAVTIRRLAQDFGVTPMALYWHVPNKDELLAAMGDSFYAGVVLPAGDEWLERLRRVTDALVASFRRHPASAHLGLPRILSCDDGRQLTEDTFGLLRAAGFTVQQAPDIARAALQTAIMLVTQEAGAELDVRAEDRAKAIETKRAALASLPPDRFPNLLECMDCLLDTDDDEAYYRFGVDLFVNGVRELHASLAQTAQSVS